MAPPRLVAADRPLGIAILAMGGQGGGVLSDWIVAMAEAQGWTAQSTSVPGVAQRTGATIYYIEMLRPRDGRAPVLSLMPTPGDVDIVLAAEWMEAGRAMLRGLVDPARTTLIASNHRSLAVVEKVVPGDGEADSGAVTMATAVAARRVVSFDMQRVAEGTGSVISAVMFGVLAGTGALPFPRDAFEAAVRAGGKGVEPSLRAFAAGFDRAAAPVAEPPPAPPGKRLDPVPATAADPRAAKLLRRVRSFPDAVQPMLFAGVRRTADYQDAAYAHEYLDRMAEVLAADTAAQGHALTNEAAKYLATAFCYDDLTRVADLKVRGTRFDRVRRETGAGAADLVYATEYMHPRLLELLGALPPGVGRFVEGRPGLERRLGRWIDRGRRIRTATVLPFLLLYVLSLARPLRRRSRRHAEEHASIATWLATALGQVPRDYGLAVEILRARRLVKGYSDTHARGLSKYDRVMASVPVLAGQPGAAAWLRRLREAALKDEGAALDGAIQTMHGAFTASAE